MTRRRRLTPQESELWARVAKATRRLRPGPDLAPDAGRGLKPDPGAPEPQPPASVAKAARAAPPSAPAALRMPPLAAAARPTAKEPLHMDRRTHARMTRGKLAPEARIDLHGMTLAQAHAALDGFIRAASRRGLRLVLVITGKGQGGGRRGAEADHGPIPRRAGALRHEVPHWLRRAPLRPLVLDIHEAHRSHGGAGALYVYLRRQRPD
ncbi:MAG: Smr/MutS family protein [Pararhodobacter sp.]|nr:Smr/MutS family protein [Pararhodobacter sp.]